MQRIGDRTSIVIPGPRSGARDPDTPTRQALAPMAVLDSGLAFGAPE
jgi:hypothetical protein